MPMMMGKARLYNALWLINQINQKHQILLGFLIISVSGVDPGGPNHQK